VEGGKERVDKRGGLGGEGVDRSEELVGPMRAEEEAGEKESEVKTKGGMERKEQTRSGREGRGLGDRR